MYSPTLGRWVTQDPIGFAAGDANLYRFVGNDPINKTDPSGLREKKPLPPKKDNIRFSEFELGVGAVTWQVGDRNDYLRRVKIIDPTTLDKPPKRL
ncbi:MAG: RHS repeat-associated core domain-containing protein [Gemmataceae bacterium]|nr:RHS repeat-associated core domain-containing protein [Gemmataceae bacterium]